MTDTSNDPGRIVPDRIAGVIARFRATRPRVHCITNAAATSFTANVLLAAGGVPSMTINPEEVGGFVTSAQALLINLGTLDPLRREAIDIAIAVAETERTPWVLDPVFVDRSPPRLSLARTLAERGPNAIRMNADELGALSGLHTGDERDRTVALALALDTTVARTGSVDFVTNGARTVEISGGHPLMASVTATGCATTALMAGFLSVEHDPVQAATACLAFVKAAAGRAGQGAAGPGSFVPAFLDALHHLSPETIAETARIA